MYMYMYIHVYIYIYIYIDVQPGQHRRMPEASGVQGHALLLANHRDDTNNGSVMVVVAIMLIRAE